MGGGVKVVPVRVRVRGGGWGQGWLRVACCDRGLPSELYMYIYTYIAHTCTYTWTEASPLSKEYKERNEMEPGGEGGGGGRPVRRPRWRSIGRRSHVHLGLAYVYLTDWLTDPLLRRAGHGCA